MGAQIGIFDTVAKGNSGFYGITNTISWQLLAWQDPVPQKVPNTPPQLAVKSGCFSHNWL